MSTTATTTDEKQPIPNQVFVGGMTPETTVQQLTKHFESLKLAPTGAPTLFLNPDGVSKGCALVPFATPEAQAAAIEALNGSKLGDQALVARADRGPRRPRREVNQDGTYLYVGNLDPDVTVQQLQDLFAAEGKIQYCSISRKRRTDRSLGWATVQLSSEEEAQKAQANLNGKAFNGKTLTVEPLKSIPRPARKPRARKERDPNLPPLENAEQPAADPSVVWVGNLPFATTEDTLRPLFAEHGEVKEIVITRDKRSKESRGWGTVTFATPEAAAAAVAKLNGTNIEDRAIHVQIRRGPRVRRRRQQQGQSADGQAQRPDGDEGQRGGRRRRRFRRGTRGEGGDDQKQDQGQGDTQGNQGTEGKQGGRGRRRQNQNQGQAQNQGGDQGNQGGDQEPGPRKRRARRRRNDSQRNDGQQDANTTTIHTGDTGAGGDRNRRRRRRRFRGTGEQGGEQGGDQGTQGGNQGGNNQGRRERKEPDRIVENPDCHLYVRNIPFTATADDLKTHFEKAAGNVKSATITVNTKGLSRGWGTVEMSSAAEAQKALALDKTDFQGRSLFVRVDNRVSSGQGQQGEQ